MKETIAAGLVTILFALGATLSVVTVHRHDTMAAEVASLQAAVQHRQALIEALHSQVRELEQKMVCIEVESPSLWMECVQDVRANIAGR